MHNFLALNLFRPFFISLLWLFFITGPLSAQQWFAAQAVGSATTDGFGDLDSDAAGNLFLSGTFSDQLTIGNQSVQSEGFDDVFLTKFSPDGEPLWTVAGGSSNYDLVNAVRIDAQQDILWAGLFWIEGHFDTLSLPLSVGSRGIFLVKYNQAGELRWGRSIEGAGLKILEDMQTDASGNIYLTGYFEGSLLFADTSLLAVGDQSLFLLKLNASGDLLWARSAGYEGEVRAKSLVLDANGDVVIAGDFQGKVVFAQDSLRTFTIDHDVFIARYNAHGEALWGRTAGGVYEDNLNAIALDPSGNAYLTGTFLGVMTLDENFEITTEGFNENFYLLRYNAQGTPTLARSLGSTADEAGTTILVRGQELFVAGKYKGNLLVDGLSITGSDNHFNAFVIAFDLDGTARWLRKATSTQYIEAERIISGNDNRLWLAGNFSSDARFGILPLQGEGLNDIFLAGIDLLASSVSGVSDVQGTVQVFPNPASSTIHFHFTKPLPSTAGRLQIFDTGGRLVWEQMTSQSGNDLTWDCWDTPPGIYFYRLFSAQNQLASGKVVIKK